MLGILVANILKLEIDIHKAIIFSQPSLGVDACGFAVQEEIVM